MKALLYPDWNRLELTDLPEPVAQDGEVVVRVAACGICGSELETFASRSPRRTPALVMGHEFCGYIVSGEANGFTKGSRVVCNAIIHCGDCVHCRNGRTQLCLNRQVFGMHRPGAFAELVAAPASCLMPWPNDLPATWASLAEPLGNGVHVAERVRSSKPESMLVIGAGPIGLMVLQAVRAMLNIPVAVVDVAPERLDAATSVGAEAARLSSKENLDRLADEFTGGMGFDAVVDAAGTGVTKSMSIDACRDEGLIVWIGLGADVVSLSTYPVTLREKTVTGSYGATGDDMAKALALMANGSVDVDSWVTTYTLDDSADAFLRQLDPKRRDIKAVITIDP